MTSTAGRSPLRSIVSASAGAGGVSTSAPAAGTCRWRWPGSWGATAASTRSTATRPPETRWPRPPPPPRPGHRPHPGGGGPDPARTGRSGLLPVRPAACARSRRGRSRRMAAAVRPGGWVVAQEPITSAGRIDGRPFRSRRPTSRHRGPAARAGPRCRTRHRGRLGRSPRRGRTRPGRRLPAAAHRRRPRGRSRRAPPLVTSWPKRRAGDPAALRRP